jgi:biopolymer transport protein ExbD
MRRRDYPLIAEINVTNFIDVTLVLLIIFMLAAPFLQGGVEIDLPKAEAEPLPTSEGLVVSVFPDRSILVNETSVKIEDLGAHLKVVHPAGSKTAVFLRADQNIPYGYVVELMAIMNKAGLTDVGLVSEPPAEKETRGR